MACCFNFLLHGFEETDCRARVLGRCEGGLEFLHLKCKYNDGSANDHTQLRGISVDQNKIRQSSIQGLYERYGSVFTILERIHVIKAFVLSKQIYHTWTCCDNLNCVQDRLKFDIHFRSVYKNLKPALVQNVFYLCIGNGIKKIKTNNKTYMHNGSFRKEKRWIVHC